MAKLLKPLVVIVLLLGIAALCIQAIVLFPKRTLIKERTQRLEGGVERLVDLPEERDRVGLLLSTFHFSSPARVGLLHADPHPGNVYLTEDHKIGLIDLGMVARINDSLQESLVKLLLAISEGRAGDAAAVAAKMASQSPLCPPKMAHSGTQVAW